MSVRTMNRFAVISLWAALCVGCGARTGLDGLGGGTDVPSTGGQGNDGSGGGAPGPSKGGAPDVVQSCTQAGITYIYAITDASVLYRFDPKAEAFRSIGPLKCPTPVQVNSMAVDRTGVAYVESEHEDLFRVDVGTAACTPLPFETGQLGWSKFGMGFSADQNGPGETLYVADASDTTESRGLARLDLTSLTLDFVGPFSQDLGTAVELTGTGDGRLFALGMPAAGVSSNLAEVDPATGDVRSVAELPVSGTSFAFAFWGGAFYTFTGDGDSTSVNRYDPKSQSLELVASLKHAVVGVGVSTCAPE